MFGTGSDTETEEHPIYVGYWEVRIIFLSPLFNEYESGFALFPSSPIDADLDVGTMPVLRSQLQHQPRSNER